MIEQFFTPEWIALGLSIIGFISFYLGKVVLDFYPNNYDKNLQYSVGFFLLLIYIIIPVVAFYLYPNILIIEVNVPILIIFIISSLLLSTYFKTKANVFMVKRGKTHKFFLETYNKYLSKFGLQLDKMPLINVNNIFTELPSQLKVIIFAYILIFLIVNIAVYLSNPLIQIFILLTFIGTLNNIVLLNNAKNIKYDKVTITTMSNENFNGYLIKKDSGYIHLINEKETQIFPKENIKNIIQKTINTDLKKVASNIKKKQGITENVLKLNNKRLSKQK